MRIHSIIATSLLCAAGLLLTATVATAATITVTTTNDELNSDGDCSLREAVQAFNTSLAVSGCAAGTGSDTITFATSLSGQTITLTKTGAGEDNNVTGDLDVIFSNMSQASLTISGPVAGNQSSIVIDGNMVNGDCSAADRVLDVFVDTGAVSPNIRLDSLTITNGCINTGSTTDSAGGGVYIHTSATSLPVSTLELVSVKVVNNKAVNQFEGLAFGGGLAVDAKLDGSLLIKSSTFSNNLVLAPPAAAIGGGAALTLKAGNNGFTINIANSKFNSNTASGKTIRGGGLALFADGLVSPSPTDRALKIASTEASNNDVSGASLGLFGAGAAIQLTQLTTNPQPFGFRIESCHFDNNGNAPGPSGMLEGRILGGGLYLFADGIDAATIDQCTFSGNSLISNGGTQDSRGGGAYLALDGGIPGSDPAFIMYGSRFYNNELLVGSGDVLGGGLMLKGDPVATYQMEGNTFSKNHIKSSASGEAIGGGAVILALSALQNIFLAGNSFVNNQVESADLAARGGGLAIKTPGCPSSSQCVLLLDTTISSNTASGNATSYGGGLALITGASPTPAGLVAHIGNVTIAHNTVTGGTAIGGGLIAKGPAMIELANSIIATNSATSGSDCAVINSVEVVSAGYNLIGINGCGLAAQNQTGDQIGTQAGPLDPKLDHLVFFFSPGFGLHQLLPNSPALDAGNPAPVDTSRLDPSPACDGFDQRGTLGPRPVDGNGDGTATCDIGAVERPNNGVPGIANPIGTVNLTENGSPVSFDLNQVFSDPDGDPLTFAISGSFDTTVVNASVVNTGSSTQLKFTPQSAGSTAVSVSASDGIDSAMISPAVNVMANQPPVVANAIAGQQRTLGDPPFSIDLATVFNDPESATLVFTASSTDTAVATVAISGTTLTVSQQNLGSTMITVTAEDNQNQTISDTFAFTVQNQAPVIASPIPDQTLNASNPQVTFDLSAVFNDPEGGSLSFTAFSGDTTVATTSLSGNILTLEAVAAGSATVTVAASDPQGQTTQDNALVTVQNQPPIISTPLLDQTLTTADAPVTIDLTTVFSDPEGATLTFTVSSSASNVATATVSGTTLTIDAVAPGLANVTVTATDAQGATVQDSAAVTVNNQSPIIATPLPNPMLTTADAPVTIDLTTVFSDPEGATLTFTVSSSASNVATATVSGTTLTIDAVAPGIAQVTVVATDVTGASVQGTAQVTVNNQAPVVTTPLPNRTLIANTMPTSINLAAVFSDPEGAGLTYAASSSNPGVAGVTLTGTVLTIAPLQAGSTQITVTATDSQSRSTTDAAAVVVSANQPPAVNSPPGDQTVTVDAPALVFDLTAIFSDPESGGLTFAATSSNASIVSVSLNGNNLSIEPLMSGTATVTITATDVAANSTSDSLQITVQNQAPVVSNAATDQKLDPDGDAVIIDLTASFSDPNGDPLSFTATSSNPSVAAASVNGNVLRIVPEPSATLDSTTVTVTATDGAGNSTTDALVINTNHVASIVDQIGNAALSVGEFSQYQLGTLFQDPDGDALTFTATSDNPSVLQARIIAGNILVLTAAAPGSAAVTVTADDGFDAVNISPTTLRVAVVSPQNANIAGGGGCVLSPSHAGGVDPSLWLLLLFPAIWRLRQARSRDRR